MFNEASIFDFMYEPFKIKNKVRLGVGEMKSNGGRQYYQQDRVYDSEDIALCESANEQFNPWYKIGGDE